MLDGEGVLLGRLGGLGPFGGEFLTLPGRQGVALSAHPRAGKGVGVVVPNLLTWPGSVVCVDIKKENWALTAGYRQRSGQKTFLFDPLSPTAGPRAGTRSTMWSRRQVNSSATYS